MPNNTFWKILAALAIGGVWYVGDGLHQSGNVNLPQLSSTAFGQGIVADRLSSEIYTVSPDGKTLYTWRRISGTTEISFSRSVEAK